MLSVAFVWIMTWSEVTRPGNRLAFTRTPAMDVGVPFVASEMKTVQMDRTRPSFSGYWLREKYNLI